MPFCSHYSLSDVWHFGISFIFVLFLNWPKVNNKVAQGSWNDLGIIHVIVINVISNAILCNQKNSTIYSLVVTSLYLREKNWDSDHESRFYPKRSPYNLLPRSPTPTPTSQNTTNCPWVWMSVWTCSNGALQWNGITFKIYSLLMPRIGSGSLWPWPG